MTESMEFVVKSINESAVTLVSPTEESVVWPKSHLNEIWQIGQRLRISVEVVKASQVLNTSPLELLNKLLKPS